jgi:hypothetical protein
MLLGIAPKELSAVSSRTIIHYVPAKRQELLHLVFELKLPYNAHTVFSTTNGVREPLCHGLELDHVPDEIPVLYIDVCDSSIPWRLVYSDPKTIQIVSLDSESRDRIKIFSIEGQIMGCHRYGFFNTRCNLIDGDG